MIVRQWHLVFVSNVVGLAPVFKFNQELPEVRDMGYPQLMNHASNTLMTAGDVLFGNLAMKG